MICDCPAGECRRFGFSGRRADICAGRVLTPAICASYRAFWEAQGIYQRATDFVSANARWVSAGSPVRDPEEVSRIFHEVCSACPLVQFDAESDVAWCKKCSCRLSATGILVNKIAMATEHCPEGKW